MELESDSRPPANRQNQPRFNLSHPLEIMLLAKMRIAGAESAETSPIPTRIRTSGPPAFAIPAVRAAK
jgi:hypothetical protein